MRRTGNHASFADEASHKANEESRISYEPASRSCVHTNSREVAARIVVVCNVGASKTCCSPYTARAPDMRTMPGQTQHGGQPQRWERWEDLRTGVGELLDLDVSESVLIWMRFQRSFVKAGVAIADWERRGGERRIGETEWQGQAWKWQLINGLDDDRRVEYRGSKTKPPPLRRCGTVPILIPASQHCISLFPPAQLRWWISPFKPPSHPCLQLPRSPSSLSFPEGSGLFTEMERTGKG
eukprot:1411810-Rhodomonas_salina.3